jgi:DNA polymerase epsilon subunit 2
MMVLVDGSYEEDYSNPTAGSSIALGNTGGIGGTIGGKFIAFSVGHPPVEKRNTSLGINETSNQSETITGPAFGWMDFLGVGSERATGARMRRLCQRLLNPPVDLLQESQPLRRSGVIAIASELNLSQPNTLSALRTLLSTYASLPIASYPLGIVLMGNFATHAALSGANGTGSIEYKESYDSLASVLSEFPELIARTTLVFVPGDNDAWPSAFSAGAATPLPRKGVPDIFTNRIRRAIAEANREIHGTTAVKRGGKEGEAIWTTNPSRLSWFGVAGEMVLFRDDSLGRLRRTAVKFNKPENDATEQITTGNGATDGTEAVHERADLEGHPSSPPSEDTQPMELDSNDLATKSPELDSHILTARSLAFTILSQSHLSPFPVSIRPQHWSYASSLSLYPLPSVLILADSEAPPYALSYSGCAVLNPATIVRRAGGRGKGARWVEWDVASGTGKVREEG